MTIFASSTDSPDHIHYRDRSTTSTSATPTSCVELLKEVAEGAVAGLLDDDDSSFSSPPPTQHSIFSLSTWTAPSAPAIHYTRQYMPCPVAPPPPPPPPPQVHDPQTSVMLRNIPNKYTRSGLLTALTDEGFEAAKHCNNLYLPMDTASGCNLGYAFLNFHSHEEAQEFMKIFDGCRLPSAGSRKVCSVVWANRQGIFQHSNPPGEFDNEDSSPTVSDPSSLTDRILTPEVSEETTNCCKVFVGGLSSGTTEADLNNYFIQFGPIKECCIVTNRQTGTSRGFGFCEFLGSDAVIKVAAAQQRKPHAVNGRVVSVRLYNFQQNANIMGQAGMGQVYATAAPAHTEFHGGAGLPPWQPGYF